MAFFTIFFGSRFNRKDYGHFSLRDEDDSNSLLLSKDLQTYEVNFFMTKLKIHPGFHGVLAIFSGSDL